MIFDVLLLVFTSFGDDQLSFFSAISRGRAAQQNAENDSAEYPARGYKLRDFPRRLLFVSSTGAPAKSRTSERLSFLSPLHCWFVFFGQTKKMNNTYCS
jgi:hypothetical protein